MHMHTHIEGLEAAVRLRFKQIEMEINFGT